MALLVLVTVKSRHALNVPRLIGKPISATESCFINYLEGGNFSRATSSGISVVA